MGTISETMQNIGDLFRKPKKMSIEEIELQKSRLLEEQNRLKKLKEMKDVESEVESTRADLAKLDHKISINRQTCEQLKPRRGSGISLFGRDI